ncbi:MAG: FixH family protein [Azovibrio sp.]|uniref:FixH family protein n=1 Tax=Azovibrio sp. TaxID=1872673 RepID=UPI003C719339
MSAKPMPVKTLSQPWYKEPWPWILMAGPSAVIVAGAITLWLALTSFDGMVEDDYYKQGLAVNQRIHRDRMAEELGLRAEVMQSGPQLRLILTAQKEMNFPAQLNFRIIHPTRGGMDQTVVLTHEGQGFYRGALGTEVDGRWHVLLEDQDLTWRLQGDWQLDADASLQLRPLH